MPKPKAKKRKPDLRPIRSTKIYTLPQIAETLGRDIATVRAWIRAGLPVLDDRKPTLVLGADLKAWLSEFWARKKRKCEPDEFYCFRCREPRRPKVGSVLIVPCNEKTVHISALCVDCGTGLNKVGSRARMAEIEAAFRTLKPQVQRLIGCDDPSDKPPSEKRPIGKLQNGNDTAQMSLDLEAGPSVKSTGKSQTKLTSRKGLNHAEKKS